KMELEHVAFPLVSTIQSIHTILGMKAQDKGIELDTIIDPALPDYVLGDETRITQVIINLAGNAIKFTEKGKVTISANVVSTAPGSCSIRFSVRDTGIGIPADKLETIFESFGQASSDTTRKFGGTGLGLTISKQLVELHGGRLMVESRLGEGSDFFFEINYPTATAPVAIDPAQSGKDVDMQGKRILVVEDNEFNQMVAVDSILDLFPALQVDVAPGGSDAIRMLQENAYDMVFMDIQMPEMDGYEATRRIRALKDEKKSGIRICAMTANVTKEEIDECSAAGMDDFMIKPFTSEQLSEKILRNILPATNMVAATPAPSRVDTIRDEIIHRLKLGLPDHLHYHGVHHTLDVLEAVERIAKAEGITGSDVELLKVAALYHDSGFLKNAHNHEATGCGFAKAELPELGFTKEEVQKICSMIMATKYPQRPKNHLEQILCDADLDYLGRSDFFEIGRTLYQELLETGRLTSEKEWNRLQVNFLSSHRYFTETAKSTRNAAKSAHLEKVKQLA
ncbi:MAG: ATP-binding protein, partial [Bacteroidota bacterium]